MKSQLKHIRLQALSLLLGLALVTVPGWPQSDLPDLGDYSGSVLSAAQERKLGRDFMRDLPVATPFHK